MNNYDEIIDALESTTKSRAKTPLGSMGEPSVHDYRAHRDDLLRFLDELDGDISVSELREALENYS